MSRNEKNRISKVTTRTGDSGNTKLATGRTISKGGQYVRAIGAVDELNSQIGLALATIQRSPDSQLETLRNLVMNLKICQQALFDIGAVLAMEGAFEAPNCEPVESATEDMNEQLPPLTEFVLPGGNLVSAQLHICRTVGRRAETDLWTLLKDWENPPEAVTQCARYLNRLSDLLFVAARFANDLVEEQWSGPDDSRKRSSS